MTVTRGQLSVGSKEAGAKTMSRSVLWNVL
jgi:hypothetical protein